jgi:hypothetical protein
MDRIPAPDRGERMTTVAVAVPWQEDLASWARPVSDSVVAGLAAGAAVGGIGGRLAMFVLRVTSNASLQGLESDDGFVIGRFSGSSLFLVVFCGVLGILGALFYLVVRGWLPERWRPALAGVFGGIVGGAAFVHTDGIDFQLLEPAWLAISLFVGLPAMYGVAMSILVERSLRREASRGGGRRWFLGLIPLIALGLLGPLGIGLLVLMALAWLIHRSAPEVASLWRSGPVVWGGRALLLGLTAWSLSGLVREATQIL